MIGQAFRSLLFYLAFYGQTAVLAIVVGVSAMLRGRTEFGWRLALYWGSSNLAFLRWLAGIRTEVSGAENIPPGPCIIAAKHMSYWDIFAILPYSGRPALIAKKELMDIPFFGRAAGSFDTIRIDRSQGGDAIPMMLDDARAALAQGCRIIIFPEGTRKAPLAETDYRYGIVRLYEGLGVPVVPVGLNSGLFWDSKSFVLWPGISRARFLPAIPPGLNGDAMLAQLSSAIEAESNRLILAAYDEGLSRPIPAKMRARLEALRTTETQSTTS